MYIRYQLLLKYKTFVTFYDTFHFFDILPFMGSFKDEVDDDEDEKLERLNSLSLLKAFWKSDFNSQKRIRLIFCSSGVPFSR